MLLWEIQVIKHIHIKILVDVQGVVVKAVEAILLRSCIGSTRTRGDTCLRRNLESAKAQVTIQSTQRSIIYRSRSLLHPCHTGCHLISMVA